MAKRSVPKDMEKILNKQAQRSASKKSTSSNKSTSSPKKSTSGKLTASQKAAEAKVRAGTKNAKIPDKMKKQINKVTDRAVKTVKQANAKKFKASPGKVKSAAKVKEVPKVVSAAPKVVKKITRPAKKLNIIQKAQRVMKAKKSMGGVAKTGRLLKNRKAVKTIAKLAKTATKGYKVAKLGAAAAGFLPEVAAWEVMERAVPAAFNYQTGSGQYGGQYDEVNAQTAQNKANWQRRYQAALKQRAAKSRLAPNIGTNQTTTILGTMNEIPARPAPTTKSPTKMTPKEYKQYLKKRYK